MTDLRSRAQRVIPGGTLEELTLPPEVQVVPARGQGSRLWDTDGREYVDYVLGGGALILGHAPAPVVEAAAAQLRAGSAFAMLTEAAIELAEALVAVIPCAEQVLFAATGAEATHFALRLARAATGRERILKFEGAYHGHHDYGILSVTGERAAAPPRPTPESAGIPARVLDEVLVVPYNDLGAAEQVVEAHRGELAAVIVEPLQRIVEPMAGFLPGLRELTRRHGIVLIFDEVVTGFRLALGGAQEYYGVTPDLAAYGKVVGGGYPLAIVAGPADLLGRADPRRTGPTAVYVSGSQFANAVAVAAARATLAALRAPGVYARLAELGRQLRERLQAVLDAEGIPGRVLAHGPIWHLLPRCAEMGPFRDHQAVRRATAAGRPLVEPLVRELVRRGVLAFPRPGRGYVRGYLSLAHTERDLAVTADALRDALRALPAAAG
ncbi:MAG TPA: aminotransferase class III-fold pyridoxal phosphate-dependent enzyme [Methylomirabilota bacterium]|jgi:glutamate-1-semialdehyde 2,1-aminomutase|nr:aminotransferase class III-fold pyridoxal phosphate-dependent enzyme [Methylomirabilota bacterium]